MQTPFRFIFPKQERLRDAFRPVANAAGLELHQEQSRQAYGRCIDKTGETAGFAASIRKPFDALRKLSEGKADMAVVGLDKFIEARCEASAKGEDFNARVTASFNCAACNMYVAAAPDMAVNKPEDLEGLRIATSYPYSAQAWLEAQGVQNCTIIKTEGDTEDEIRDGSADAIFEIVDSGKSLIDNGLERKIHAYGIEAVLVERKGTFTREAQDIAASVKKRLTANAADLYSEAPPAREAQTKEWPAFTELNACSF